MLFWGKFLSQTFFDYILHAPGTTEESPLPNLRRGTDMPNKQGTLTNPTVNFW